MFQYFLTFRVLCMGCGKSNLVLSRYIWPLLVTTVAFGSSPGGLPASRLPESRLAHCDCKQTSGFAGSTAGCGPRPTNKTSCLANEP